jgi:methionyl-tRNA formyltransferase
MKRVLQFAYGQAAPAALRSLKQEFQVVGLVVPAGANVVETPVLAEPLAADLPKVHCPKPNDLPALAAAHRAEAVVICSYDRILPKKFLPPVPVVNVHYAPLPRYRGRATVNWAILNGLRSFALTIHQVVPELDAGAILSQEWCDIGDSDTVADVYGKLNSILEKQLGPVVAEFLAGRLVPVPQNPAEATYVCTRLPEDGMIDWRRPAREIHALVRAVAHPFPGAFTYLGHQKLTVWESALPESVPHHEGAVPGRVSKVWSHGAVDVLCGDGMLRLIRVQPEHGAPCAPRELISSVKMTLGDGMAARVGRLEATIASLELELERVRTLVKRQMPNTDQEGTGQA